MTKFEEAGYKEKDISIMPQEMKDMLLNSTVYLNDVYQVAKRELEEGITHLSIRRIDRKPLRDWRDFQEIKNQLTDKEREGLEIFPAESRLVDGANQYHLWVLPLGSVIPTGFNDGRQVTNNPNTIKGLPNNAKQRHNTKYE